MGSDIHCLGHNRFGRDHCSTVDGELGDDPERASRHVHQRPDDGEDGGDEFEAADDRVGHPGGGKNVFAGEGEG